MARAGKMLSFCSLIIALLVTGKLYQHSGVSALAIRNEMVFSMELAPFYKGVHTDSASGEGYHFFTDNHEDDTEPDFGGENDDDDDDDDNYNKDDHLIKDGLNETSDALDKRSLTAGWRTCKIWQPEYNNTFGCHNRHSPREFLLTNSYAFTRSVAIQLLDQAFNQVGGSMVRPRAVCAEVRGHKLCTSWADYYNTTLDIQVTEDFVDECMGCFNYNLSGSGWVRFMNGQDHVICFSNRPTGCTPEICSRFKHTIEGLKDEDRIQDWPHLHDEIESTHHNDALETPGEGKPTWFPPDYDKTGGFSEAMSDGYDRWRTWPAAQATALCRNCL